MIDVGNGIFSLTGHSDYHSDITLSQPIRSSKVRFYDEVPGCYTSDYRHFHYKIQELMDYREFLL